MTEEESRKLSSLIGSLKGTVINNVKSNDWDLFFSWCRKLALDTRKDKKEKFLPSNYPTKIQIGDIVHNFFFCSFIIFFKG